MQVGFSCVLATNTGDFEDPVWDDVDNVRDATLNIESTEADASRRGGGGFAEAIQGLHQCGIEFDLAYDPDDSQYTRIRSGMLARTPIEVLALDGPVSEAGSQGLHATMAVFTNNRNEPLDDTVTISVTMKPTPNANHTPEWYTSDGNESTTEGD